MSDWPGPELAVARTGGVAHSVIHSTGAGSGMGEYHDCTYTGLAVGAWPTINKAFYMPIYIQQSVTVYQLAIQVSTQSGNVDVGIYDEFGTRLVSSGSTAVAAAGIQVFDIADTFLIPGTYYLAQACDNTTAQFVRAVIGVNQQRLAGGQEQTSALPLPATATFAPCSFGHGVAIAAFLAPAV